MIINYNNLTLTTSIGYSNRGVSHDHELREFINSKVMDNAPEVNPTTERSLVVRSSLRSKLPPKLILKSANLRVLDPIGQGNVILLSHFKLFLSLKA